MSLMTICDEVKVCSEVSGVKVVGLALVKISPAAVGVEVGLKSDKVEVSGALTSDEVVPSVSSEDFLWVLRWLFP